MSKEMSRTTITKLGSRLSKLYSSVPEIDLNARRDIYNNYI